MQGSQVTRGLGACAFSLRQAIIMMRRRTHLDVPPLVQHEVLGLQVSVDDALLV